jgi:hypothetical protein
MRARADRSHATSRSHAPTFAEPPLATDAWWLSRTQAATFTQRRIALPEECARALRVAGDAAPLVVEFNGASFRGAAVAARGGRYELDLGSELAQEMAEVLDEDDELDVQLVAGRSQPTLSIHPHASYIG